MQAESPLPLYLTSASDFRAYLSDQFDPLTNTQRGAKFAEAVLVYVQAQDWAKSYPNVRLNPKKAGELGRDILSDADAEGSVLFVESKYSLEGVEELDSVLSKWRQVEHEARGDDDGGLWPMSDLPQSLPTYALVSGTDVAGTVRRYESQAGRGSRDFYDLLRSEERVHICGLAEIYQWLRTTYLRQHGVPRDFKIKSIHPWIHIGNVFLGAMRGGDIVDLVEGHGESLFFENIRGWIGAQSQVNSTIMRTIAEEPSKFLERNNGVTFRVQDARPSSDQTLAITRGNIINGCQTTMALWQCRPTDPDLAVQVKVVDAGDQQDAWKIAESANYQNTVTLLELKLAQHLRPQLVARHASRLGRPLDAEEPNNLESVLRAVSDSDASYNLAKFLFLGLFSRKPNDLFADNYTLLNGPLIAAFYESRPDAESKLFEMLFSLMDHGQRSITAAAKVLAEQEHSAPFARVFHEGAVKYRALVLLLAACGQLRIDLSNRPDSEVAEVAKINGFVDNLYMALHEDPAAFSHACKWALNTLFSDAARDNEDPQKTQQRLSSRVTDISFTRLYHALTRSLDLVQSGS